MISSIVLIVLSPQMWSGPESAARFPLGNPAIVTVALGFIACIAGSLLLGRDEVAEATFDEVRAGENGVGGAHGGMVVSLSG